MLLLMLITGRDLHLREKWGIKKEAGGEGKVSVKIKETIHVNPRCHIHACTDLQQRHPIKHRVCLL